MRCRARTVVRGLLALAGAVLLCGSLPACGGSDLPAPAASTRGSGRVDVHLAAAPVSFSIGGEFGVGVGGAASRTEGLIASYATTSGETGDWCAQLLVARADVEMPNQQELQAAVRRWQTALENAPAEYPNTALSCRMVTPVSATSVDGHPAVSVEYVLRCRWPDEPEQLATLLHGRAAPAEYLLYWRECRVFAGGHAYRIVGVARCLTSIVAAQECLRVPFETVYVGGESAAPAPVTSSPSPTSAPTYRLSDMQGIRYKVLDWLTMIMDSPMGAGRTAFIYYMATDPDGRAGGCVVTVGMQLMEHPPNLGSMVATLQAGDILRAQLPQEVRRKAVIRLVGQAKPMKVGLHDWPAAGAQYRLTVPKENQCFFGESKAIVEFVVFVRGHRLYKILLGGAPVSTFSAHQRELETTLRTIRRLP